MIDVKEATSVAIKTAADFLSEQKVYDLALEEIELTEDDKFWLVTLGFSVEDTVPISKGGAGMNLLSPIMNPSPAKYTRKYKIFKIDANTGKFQAMKIREI